MRNKQDKKETIDAIEWMIRHAAKGPSGFWTGDYEGCGNPDIFPEFAEGLQHGRLVQKKHYLCPWNTAIMYGDGYGNISTGCYHSCSIDKARYLTEQELREILIRFKKRLEKGDYDNVDYLTPLLTKKENRYLEERILTERLEKEESEEHRKQERIRKATALLAKYPAAQALLASYYGENDYVSEKGGLIFFRPDSQKDVVGAEKMTYDEYLDVQLTSLGKKYRSGFANGLFNYLFDFKGQIEKINEKHICFKRIFISGIYPDGEMYDDKEDHVWMDIVGFEGLCVGDCVAFGAEVYRYIKTGHGKQIDYGLRNPKGIRKIENYELPSDDELAMQRVRKIVCEACFFSEHCNRNECMMNLKQKSSLEQQMFEVIKGGTDKGMEK